MNKEKWQNLYTKLNDISADFLFAYHDCKHGKNKKIKADAERKVNSIIRNADFYIRQHPEAFCLLTGGENMPSDGRTINYDEFLQHRYFGNDLILFLKKVQEKFINLQRL